MKPPDSTPSNWSWKTSAPAESSRTHLKYEPGNLGDLLKGIWAIETARAVVRLQGSVPFIYADPFAGAPKYPLSEAAAQRLARFDPTPFHDEQCNFFAQGQLASTATLVKQIVESENAPWQPHLFELDPTRRSEWTGVKWLNGMSGESALLTELKSGLCPHLILIDPYDFLKGGDWKTWWPEVLEQTQMSAVLVYLYNRAPQSAGHFNVYRDFRTMTREHLGENRTAIFGRIPNDFILPRAYHEMALLGSTELLEDLKLSLEAHTKLIAQKLSSAGVFETE